MKKLSVLTLIAMVSVALLSCSKDDPVPELDQEVITNVSLTFTEVDENDDIIGSAMEYNASSDEGLGLGGDVVIDDIDGLVSGKRYLLKITAFNGIANEDVTEEIEEEGDHHQFFFVGSAFIGNTSFLEYAYADEDEDGNPIGLMGYVTVNENAGSENGIFNLVLRHDLDKNHEGADNPSWENFVQAGGESDLDIDFDVIF
ncbi:hypothetical protein [Echinicola vietnamensis]|uniref:Type 1 periplasmic binding fold superfamily protein n=1 Tax=Echinicola vietnamensis (strain DSM 17526 / LMG 23754 / KMM 6221) TaxID=926556 RepID=L0G339_ECHVK|nr:hypothetical protein [Echinicola vietnamensis]AGA79260.1 hypothetical protein Echvi_3022 [Echinicola vietnamensis DSM 17526]